ncbi:Protein kinase C conserved region 2 (CalB), partial [Tyrophagus putrescentiae]
PIEASTLLGLAGVVVACFLAVYIYHCKTTCFQKVSRCWCCQKTTLAKRRISKELVNAFSYDDELEVSSECDEDVMRHLQQRPQCKYTKFSSYLSEGTEYHHRPYNKLLDYNDKHTAAAGEMVFNGVDALTAPKNSTGALVGPRIVRQISVCQPDESDHSGGSCYDGYYKQHRSANILKQQAIYTSLTLKNKMENTKLGGKDLISMAEKGRIGKQTSTEASSEAGSNEDSLLIDKKTHILRRLKMASSETESTQSSNLPDFSPNTTISEPNMCNSIKVGRLEASFAYDAPFQTNMCFCDSSLKRRKFRTKSKPIFCPIFNQTFTFNRISPDEIMNSGLRFRVYCSRHLIGESRLLFACMKPQQQETKLWFTLEPHKRIAADLRSEVSRSSLAHTDSTSSQSLHNTSPELLLGLSYNGVTGRLSVIIIKGSQFRSISTRAPDTFVKITLQSSSGQEIARSKTSVIRGQPNPHFKETFIFQVVALFQLPDVRLTISAYNKRSIKRKELIGWITFGNNSGDEEQSHWNDMRDSKGEQVCRWHVLMQS